MEEPGDPPATRAAALVAELSAQQRVLAAAQARQAALMVEFGQSRRTLDEQRNTDRDAADTQPRYRPGEFAAMEIGLAMRTSRHSLARTVAMAQRLQQETPDVWDAWLAGDIDRTRRARRGLQDRRTAGPLAQPIHRPGRTRPERRMPAAFLRRPVRLAAS